MRQVKTFLIFLFCFLFFCISIIGQTNPNHVKVKGYYKSNGTYVKPYFRTAPNNSNSDNFSTQGNTNPYTGQPGWIKPDSKYNTFYYSNQTYSPSEMKLVSTTSSPIVKYDDRTYVEDENGGYSCYLKKDDKRTFSVFDMKDELVLYIVINHRGDWRVFDPNRIYVKTIFLNE
jgi:hypothetical protein